ncbi:MAG: hypothetical protein II918_03510 [Firmicutes bacterium]|nr:hypothetical protein [Clostridia bacterium]MBQ4467269.1 hypothetical protein [Bacillota bacterium]
METVLYDFNSGFPIKFAPIIELGIALIVPLAFLAYSVCHTFLYNKEKNGKLEGGQIVFTVVGYIIGPVLSLIFIFGIVFEITDQFKYHEILANDNAEVIEGYVEHFHAMPYNGHDTEHFEINGTVFEYTDYSIVSGYHKTYSHGGVIKQNGQHLKIKYIIIEHLLDGDLEDYKADQIYNGEDLDPNYNVVINENGELVRQEFIILYISELLDT